MTMPASTLTSPAPTKSPDWNPAAKEIEATRNDFAIMLDHWRTLHEYYYRKLNGYLRFAVPPDQSVLVVGCEDGALLTHLRPGRGVGVDCCKEMISQAKRRNPQHQYHHGSYHEIDLEGTFDYIILYDVTGEISDLQVFMNRLARVCTPTTRLLVVQHNYLWRPIFRLAARLGLKRPEPPQNWLSIGDMQLFLYATGFETITIQRKLFCPAKLLGLGPIVNAIFGVIPFLSRLASTKILTARPFGSPAPTKLKSCSIVLTVRDEHDNIEPLVRSIPQVGETTEIIFVEGHSTDGTREEVQRVIEAYPEKNIRLVVQPGVGQGDAIREGFDQARGDAIILLEADQTSPASEVLKVWQVLEAGRAEFVNGTRAVYPKLEDSMPILKKLGNLIFAVWFTWFLGQRTTDVLCGIKGIVAGEYRKLRVHWGFLGLRDPFGDFELLFGAARLGLRTCEVPIRYAPRSYGRSKSQILRHGWMLFRLALRALRIFKCS